MHLARLAGLDDQAGLRAQALADQVVVHRRGRQQRRDRHALGRHGAVGQDQDVAGRPARSRSPRQQMRSSASSRPAAPSAAGQVMSIVAVRNAPSSSVLDRADLLQLVVGQDRLRDFEPLVRAGVAAEQVRPRADHRDQRHHQLLADRIDRRVGDLGEVLLEVVVEQLRLRSRARRSACRCPSSRSDRRPPCAIGSRKNWMSSCV